VTLAELFAAALARFCNFKRALGAGCKVAQLTRLGGG
jgi:hypothetical protein